MEANSLSVSEKSKQEWARRHLLQQGNPDPTDISIQIYVNLITPGRDGYDKFWEDQYHRWITRDEELARIEYDEQQAKESSKTLNQRYIEDEDNDGPFFQTTHIEEQ